MLTALIESPGVVRRDTMLLEAIEVWRSTPSLSFVDAYLGVRAQREGRPVYTVNRRDFERQGVEAPDIRELAEQP